MVVASSNKAKDNYTIIIGCIVRVLLLLCSLGITFIIITFHSPYLFIIAPPISISQPLNLIQPSIGRGKCDLYKGKWIPDPNNGSLYTSTGCAWIPDWKNCFKHGRKDVDFVNWRWKPDECEVPRFDPITFLRVVKDKRMLFIGDSVARNHMESLLCLLSQVESPTEIDKDLEEKNIPRTLYFSSHNFTIIFIRSVFLVHSEEILINGTSSGSYNLHLNNADDKWVQELPGANYAVISDVHWFFRKNYLYEHGQQIGCIHCSEPNVTDLGITFATRKALQTALDTINGCDNCSAGLVTFLRTFSSSHFENGAWNGGGYCNKTRPAVEGEVNLGGIELDLRNGQVGEIERVKMEGVKRRGKRFEVLDVTRAMLMRPDGHPGLHWDNRWAKGVSDCLHWCLPGPIDVWNEFLLSALLRLETCSSLGPDSDACQSLGKTET